MELRPHYRTIVLSDIHLGTSHSKVDEVSDFLSAVDCDRLILNGDIIDGWHLQKSGVKKWKAEHTRFFKIIMKMMGKSVVLRLFMFVATMTIFWIILCLCNFLMLV